MPEPAIEAQKISSGDPNPQLSALIQTMARLRAPGGCPWDAEQNHESLVQYLVEECWELVEAIESGNKDHLLEELGDVLYQVLFHADIAAHANSDEAFTLEDVAEHMRHKMVSRHPHVFGNTVANTPEQVMSFWEVLKAAEKPERSSVLDGVPQGMPALALAQKVLGKAEKVGVRREPAASSFNSEGELGAQLFAIVAAAKAQGFDAERALRAAIRSFNVEVRAAEPQT